MLHLLLFFLLIFTFCWSINVKLEIDDNYLQQRSFDYLLNNSLWQPMFNCFLLYRNDNIENKINGEILEINKIYLFKDIPSNFNKDENNLDIEFIIEFQNQSILSKIIPMVKNQV